MNIFEAIKSLVKYAIDNEMIEKEDEIWAINRICEALKIDSFEESEAKESDLEKILAVILDYAVENGLCEDSVVYRDLFDTKIMGLITPRPSDVIKKFKSLYEKSPKDATDFYYKLSQDSNIKDTEKNINYILTYEPPTVAKDILKQRTNRNIIITPLNTYLQELMENVQYMHWYFGSLHLDLNISKKMTAVFNEIIPIG
jgi:galactose-1-phosphate uridylyltransferase